uniref:BPL/LPL catalytic domain-containing protein n=1 Tax=Ditylenchus dipsaci TaxID=166011 RepID=A0A915DLH5_9BILA
MQWENSSYSASIVPNYFCKLRQESYSTHNNTQSSDQTETGSTYARDTVYVGVSPSTTLNDVSDCLMLDSKPSRHSEEISHDNTAAENRSPATKAQAAKVGKKGQSILMAYPLLTKSAAPTALNQLIEEHKSSLVGSTTMLNDDNAHSFSKSTCKADEQQKVAMDAIEDGLRTSLTQINEEKQSCSFAVNIKSTLPLLNKKKLLAKRFNSLQQPELDYYFYAPNFNYSMQFNNNTDIDNTAATTATSSRVKKRLSVSSVSGRSVSPLTLSLLANYGSREVLDPLLSANAAQPDSFLFSRRASSRNHRRFHSSEPRRSTLCLTDSGYKSILKSSLSSPKPPERMHSVFETANRPFKPPYILVYSPLDTFTVNHLSTECLIRYPWFDTNCTCLLISNTKHLDDQAWSRLQAYFVNSGKILFVCQNHLLANLTNCRTLKKQTSILRNAFGKKSTSSALGKDLQKDFEAFMKKSLKKMEIEKEVNEAYHAKDVVGGYRFSVVFFKKIGQPLLLYMQNGEQKTQSSALFSDATTEQLLSSSLLGEALCRLGIEVVERGDPSNSIPQLTNGYLVCQKDRLLLDLKGLTYGKLVGNHPKLLFLHPATKENREEVSLAVDSKTLTVETRLRKASIEDSESNKYFNRLSTKSLGRVLIYIPVCETTLDVSKSLSRALPSYDGVLVVAGYQTNAQSRAGKEYLSPKGCASFTFNFVIPVDSCLGQSILFIQHIMAVAIVDAVSKLVDDENFPLQIKWPNDLYFERKHKIGGVLVDSLLKATQYECMIAGSINVINTKPTMCLNDMLPTDCDRTLTVEEVLAEIMNKFEYYVNMFVHRGKDAFLRRYYELWMHSREEVSILHKHNNCKEKVIIRGLDEHGFLEVRSKQTGQTFSVHNDGNSFDMMRGLIHPNQ